MSSKGQCETVVGQEFYSMTRSAGGFVTTLLLHLFDWFHTLAILLSSELLLVTLSIEMGTAHFIAGKSMQWQRTRINRMSTIMLHNGFPLMLHVQISRVRLVVCEQLHKSAELLVARKAIHDTS
jgi:hypothetical protein